MLLHKMLGNKSEKSYLFSHVMPIDVVGCHLCDFKRLLHLVLLIVFEIFLIATEKEKVNVKLCAA